MPTSCFSYKFESICVIFSSSGTDESGMANTVSGSHDIKELSNLLSGKGKVVFTIILSKNDINSKDISLFSSYIV